MSSRFRFTRSHQAAFLAERRDFLRRLVGTGFILATGSVVHPVWAKPKFDGYPFTLGVASGDPAADGFVIWTKIAPKPLEQGGGVGRHQFEVEWMVATDRKMRKIVQRGKAMAIPELGHSVHVEVDQLEPAHDYFYHFVAGGERSPVARARTLPAEGTTASKLRFATVGCQRYEDGYFTAYRHLADEQLDFVFHYGDYIYERSAAFARKQKRVLVREMPGAPGTCITLDDFRNRYSIYQLDPDLQAAHASTPFVMSFDDHEVGNDWAGETLGRKTKRSVVMERRAAAFQAWYEHMPVRRAQLPQGPDILAYRRIRAGNLLSVNVLDTRQYRAPVACGGGVAVECADARDPQRSFIGDAQERWLFDGFRNHAARWNVVAQQVPMMRMDRNPDPDVLEVNMDKWDGYVGTRDRLFKAVESAKLSNFVVLTGDVHVNCAGELKKDFSDPKSRTLGVEFIGTSISSNGDGYDTNKGRQSMLKKNPHLKFFNGQRGYVRHSVTPERWQADYQVLDTIATKDGKLTTRKSFVVEYGKPGLRGI